MAADGMVDHAHESAILLLASMYKARNPHRRRSAFVLRRRGNRLSLGSFSTEVNFESAKLAQVALYLRKHGTPHLRLISIGDIEANLMRFTTEQYELLAGETLFRNFECSYEEHLSQDPIKAFANALLKSEFFREPRLITLFPLLPIRITKSFNTSPFFLAAPADLVGQIGEAVSSCDLIPNSFPPFKDWRHRRETPTAWLGARAPTLDAAKQVRAAVLGAVALVPHHMERYMFSKRQMIGGYVTFSHVWTLAFEEPNTPPLMTDIEIGERDQPWLAELARKLTSSKRIDRQHLRALEYYYRAWSQVRVERFPTLFAVLDALFGDPTRATLAVVDAVGPLMGEGYTSERIRLMLKLRGSVIHGGAPNVYESSKYEAYYRAYGRDAVHDLEIIVARCLQKTVFPELLAERRHTHADLILRETGREV